MKDEKQQKGFIKTCVEDICAAFMLLSRIPVSWEKISNSPPNLARAMWAYPLVGLVTGSLAGLFFLGTQLIGIPVAVGLLLALATSILITGAFHEDGLADVADGFGGGLTREKKLDIMRDSRIGTYGGLALLMALALKIFSLLTVSEANLAPAFIISATLSRLMILTPLMVLKPARASSLSTEAGKPSLGILASAGFIALGTCLLFGGIWITVTVTISALLVSFVFCRLAYKQVGGYSGDILGATQQLSEIAILITLATLWQAPL